ncbi:hypothetical protein SAMN06265795_10853 [Noviherbaspirillum humi]|uniref:Uncharacterized protein n=1 Tax=Noviherbaspirillum humi TaxID=1688639 RepID=A0A239I0Q8_9BURK|nr:hypothetical protein [Noviherbaspirillum humi]SNS87145.1 hypothetical protein SAMN06265795_10853 [Noviherbaspirillum humi]
MNRFTTVVFVALCAIGSSAVAQDSSSGIRESTDPSRIAEVERHARDLQSQQQSSGGSASSTTGMTQGDMDTHGKRHHGGKRHTMPRSRGGAAGGQPESAGTNLGK